MARLDGGPLCTWSDIPKDWCHHCIYALTAVQTMALGVLS